MKWNNALKDFALYLKIERGMSEHTVNNYSLDVQKLVQYLEVHDMSLSPLQITSEDIQSFIYKMAKEITGYLTKDLVGHHVFEFFPDRIQEILLQHMRLYKLLIRIESN